jgi:hypothetical protein
MPVTLAEAKLNAVDDVDVQVIDEFAKSSDILNRMTFDDVVSPTGGDTLTYGYRRLITQVSADFRAINSEYTPTEVTTQRYTVDLKPLGGSFQVDRVVSRLGPAASGVVALNMSQKIKAARAKFADAVINGDTAVDSNGFDGLSKILTGTTTEYDRRRQGRRARRDAAHRFVAGHPRRHPRRHLRQQEDARAVQVAGRVDGPVREE